MRLITDSLLPGRWSASRVPPTKTEMDSTSILKVSIVSASAKVRVGGPSEDRKDLKDEALRGRVWTGAVPVWLQWGEPVPAETNGREGVERYIEGWRVGENATGKGYAYEAIEMTGGK